MNEDTVTVDGLPEETATDTLLDKDDLLDGILNRCNDIEAVGEEAVEIAIDVTLCSVVSWLFQSGYKHAANDLEELLNGTV